MRSDGSVETDLLRIIEKDTMGNFVGLLRDIVEQMWEKRVDCDVWLECLKSGYGLLGCFLHLKD